MSFQKKNVHINSFLSLVCLDRLFRQTVMWISIEQSGWHPEEFQLTEKVVSNLEKESYKELNCHKCTADQSKQDVGVNVRLSFQKVTEIVRHRPPPTQSNVGKVWEDKVSEIMWPYDKHFWVHCQL